MRQALEVGDDAAFFPITIAGGIRAVAATDLARACGSLGGGLGAPFLGFGQRTLRRLRQRRVGRCRLRLARRAI